ncbi:MAG: hypothetical protein HY376_02140 [Candidatus Blackburnbacteria bacterium]|nr:hypothetical protein [Candidatus Blackburnbacteria bacterium]
MSTPTTPNKKHPEIRYPIKRILEQTEDWVIYEPSIQNLTSFERGTSVHLASPWLEGIFSKEKQEEGEDLTERNASEFFKKIDKQVISIQKTYQNPISFFWNKEKQWFVLCIDCSGAQVLPLLSVLKTTLLEMKAVYYIERGLSLPSTAAKIGIAQVELD